MPMVDQNPWKNPPLTLILALLYLHNIIGSQVGLGWWHRQHRDSEQFYDASTKVLRSEGGPLLPLGLGHGGIVSSPNTTVSTFGAGAEELCSPRTSNLSCEGRSSASGRNCGKPPARHPGPKSNSWRRKMVVQRFPVGVIPHVPDPDRTRLLPWIPLEEGLGTKLGVCSLLIP